MEEVTRLSTKRNVTVFPGKIKVGPICPTFIRGDPYEPQKPPEKVSFSDHMIAMIEERINNNQNIEDLVFFSTDVKSLYPSLDFRS